MGRILSGAADSFHALARLAGMAFENVDYKSLDIPAAPIFDPSIIPDFPKNKVPRHVGVIMDGNGRWAQQRGLIRTDGHPGGRTGGVRYHRRCHRSGRTVPVPIHVLYGELEAFTAGGAFPYGLLA